MTLARLLLGRRLANREQSDQKIGVIAGVPAVGLDGLASSAYGPEAALTILIPLGAAGLAYIGPIVGVILALLAVLYVSYRQTIGAYPTGGGSYTVAKENLGTNAGLLAAAALLIDYVLNVAVAVSAGVAALTSAFPPLHRYTLPLCLGVLVLITLVNLRGTAESGWAFALPTYLFLGSFAVVIGLGLARAAAAGGHPTPVERPPPLSPGVEGATLWLLMRAFASGCSAMTGVEAVSNGMSAFRDPPVLTAKRTLTAICGCLAALLAGIVYLAHAYGIGAMHQDQPGYQTVLSQLLAAIVGRGWFYYLAIGSLLCVLALSANTSFVGFPRLCRLIAGDGFLPRAFASVGRRLVYSVGILFLAAVAGLLLVAFGGITDRLIPLFAVGAFGAFTASQSGMVVHWWRAREQDKVRSPDATPGGPAGDHSRHRHTARLAVNGVGAVTTGAALVVILVAKFAEGAWITLLALPALFLLFRVVKRHYLRVARQIRTQQPLRVDPQAPPVIVLPTEGWNRVTEKSLRLAMHLSPDVSAVHLTELDGDADPEDQIRAEWEKHVAVPAREAGRKPPTLEIVRTPYRQFCRPLLACVERAAQAHPGRRVAVMVPEVVKRRWWQFVLHGYRAQRLRSALLRRGDRRTLLINVPWYLED